MQVCLPAIWALSFLLVTYRLGVLPAESAASLKLLDKGVAKEALAALVLVQFPVELVSAVVAGRCVCVCVCACWRLVGVSAGRSLCALTLGCSTSAERLSATCHFDWSSKGYLH